MTSQTRRRRRPGPVVLGATAFVLLTIVAGCAYNKGVVYNRNFTSGYEPLSLSGQSTPIQVVTLGTPADGQSQEEVTAATVKGLRDRGPRWANIGFTQEPQEILLGAYHLRVAYGAAPAFPRSRLCATDLQTEEIGNDGTYVRSIMALCRGERWVSVAEGTPGADADIESPDFSSYVGLMARRIMPPRNPILIDECLIRRCD